ncbi:MAG: hypothetical protein NT003_01385, partial [Candidatus Magasanikbacteria bacterium]|nr:hypothetical protein [Candidatus Magasanikbacteria bacterium]
MTQKPTIGVMGAGMVGGATIRYFQTAGYPVVAYDPDPNKNFLDPKLVADAAYIFICVPTPYEAENGGFSLAYVHQALDMLPENKTVIIKSTVLPGSTEALQEKYPKLKILFNPEFL